MSIEESKQMPDQTLKILETLLSQPSLLTASASSRPLLHELLQSSLSSQLVHGAGETSNPTLQFHAKFSPQQVWQQLLHFTEKQNVRSLDRIDKFVQSEGFRKAREDANVDSDQDDGEAPPQEDQDKSSLDQEEVPRDEEGEYEMAEEGEIDMDDQPDLDDYGKEERDEEDMLSGDALDEHLDDLEEEEIMRDGLKIPKDLVGRAEEDDDYGEELDGGAGFGEDAMEEKPDDDLAEKDYEAEDEVFAFARENNEMAARAKDYANQEMVGKIERIEDQMMDEKKWQMKGELMCKDREQNGLLEEHLDFDTATKLPPQVTQETTNQIEALIKQRVLDELFDDPVRKELKLDGKDNGDDFQLSFTKGKGLGDVYADDYANKLMAANPDVFNEVSGADSGVKKEIDDLFDGLMRNLNQLSNIHFVPKRKTKEAAIRTQNVPALTMEEAVPIGVSQGQTKSAKEVFSVTARDMTDKDELTKEEKRGQRARRKRQLKARRKAVVVRQKETNREKGIALLGDRFAARQVQHQLDKKKKAEKKSAELAAEPAENTKRKYKSGKFFPALNSIAKSDKERKDLKRQAKETGKAEAVLHQNTATKKFKM